MKLLIIIKILFLLSLQIICVECIYEGKLHLDSDGRFKIAQFTDMHYCKEKKLNRKTTDLQKMVIEKENPNFIIYTGDMISGEVYNQWIDWLINPGWFRKKWQEYSSIPKEKKIPYSIVIGNHDLYAHLPGEMIVDMDRNNPYSLTKHSPKGVKGATNYVLPVYDYEEKNVVLYLWIFDSQTYSCGKDEKMCGSIHKSAIEWYKKETEKNYKKNKNRHIPGLVFFHIPTSEYAEEFKNSNNVKGDMMESVSCPLTNNGFIDSLKEYGNIKATFCGHNHLNDYVINYKGLLLYYGRISGFCGYEKTYYNNVKGSRIIEYDGYSEQINSWIREEDGTKVNQQRTGLVFDEQCNVPYKEIGNSVVTLVIMIIAFIITVSLITLTIFMIRRKVIRQKNEILLRAESNEGSANI